MDVPGVREIVEIDMWKQDPASSEKTTDDPIGVRDGTEYMSAFNSIRKILKESKIKTQNRILKRQDFIGMHALV